MSRRKGAAMFCFGWLSLTVLYLVFSRFFVGLFLRKYPTYNRKNRFTFDQGNGLFKVMGHETFQEREREYEWFIVIEAFRP